MGRALAKGAGCRQDADIAYDYSANYDVRLSFAPELVGEARGCCPAARTILQIQDSVLDNLQADQVWRPRAVERRIIDASSIG